MFKAFVIVSGVMAAVVGSALNLPAWMIIPLWLLIGIGLGSLVLRDRTFD